MTKTVGYCHNALLDLKVSKMTVVNVVDPVFVSDAAVQKINLLAAEEQNQHLKLRVYVTGGGCAGFQYGFSFEDEILDDDTVISRADASILIDPLSIQYLTGSTVDYLEGLEGARFVINNPLAQTTCGCGSSFSMNL